MSLSGLTYAAAVNVVEFNSCKIDKRYGFSSRMFAV